MPVNPLEALRNAQGIGADPGPHPDDWVGTAVQGLLGTIGLGDDSSQANRGGQLIGAALPLGPVIGRGLKLHPAVQQLMELLDKAPSMRDPSKVALGERLGGWVPPRTAIVDPPGFTTAGTSPFMDRDPNLVQQYVLEQNRLAPLNMDAIKENTASMTSSSARNGQRPLFQSPYGSRPSRSTVAPKPKAKLNEIPSGFESKFSRAWLDGRD